MFFNKKANNTILLFHFNNDFKYIGKNVGPVTWGGGSYVSGKFDQAAKFDIAPIIFDQSQWFWDIISEGNYTIELWYYCTNKSSKQGFITSDISGSPTGFAFYIGYDNIIYGNFDNYENVSSSVLEIGWNHIALSSNNKSCGLYINGINKFNKKKTISKQDYDICIGGRTGSGDNMTGGIIDEMRISNIPRYTTNFTPPSQPFIID